MPHLNNNLIGDRRTPDILLRRSKYSWLLREIDKHGTKQKERTSLRMLIVAQILIVIPFPFLIDLLVQKPKYIIGWYILFTVSQFWVAFLNIKHKGIMLFSSLGALLLMAELVFYVFYLNM